MMIDNLCMTEKSSPYNFFFLVIGTTAPAVGLRVSKGFPA